MSKWYTRFHWFCEPVCEENRDALEGVMISSLPMRTLSPEYALYTSSVKHPLIQVASARKRHGNVRFPGGFFFGLEGSWGQPQGPNFPPPWATMLALRLDCSTAALTTPQKALPIWKLVELKMLDFSDHTRTGISILTSAAVLRTHSIFNLYEWCKQMWPNGQICGICRRHNNSMLR